jgi:hypothetical protein
MLTVRRYYTIVEYLLISVLEMTLKACDTEETTIDKT